MSEILLPDVSQKSCNFLCSLIVNKKHGAMMIFLIIAPCHHMILSVVNAHTVVSENISLSVYISGSCAHDSRTGSHL